MAGLAHIDHVDTVHLHEVNGVIRKLVRKVRVTGLQSTDYLILLEALDALGVPKAGSRLAPDPLISSAAFGMLVLAERDVKVYDNDPGTVDIILEYQHFMESDNQEIAAGFVEIPGNAGGTQTFTQTGFWMCPPGITEVEVECYGGGAAAASINEPLGGDGAGGGGGGAYAYKIVPVTPGSAYDVTIGLGGTPATPNGGNTWFRHTTIILAEGGKTGTATTGGLGGLAQNSVGTIVHSGGSGGTGGSGANGNGGGGGGSSGTPSADGWDGGDAYEHEELSYGGSGGLNLNGFGDGGKGADVALGAYGQLPGGGGGGNANGTAVPANGADGMVVLTWQPVAAQAIGGSRLTAGSVNLFGKNKTSVHQVKTNYYNEPIPSITGVWNNAQIWAVGAVVDYKGFYWYCVTQTEIGDPPPAIPLYNALQQLILPSKWRLAVAGVDYLILDPNNTQRRQIVVGHRFPRGHAKHSGETIYQSGEITVMQPQRNFAVQGHIYTDVPWVIANKIIGAINKLPWMDAEEWEWMCTEVAWEAMFIRKKYKFRFEFQHNPDRWLPTAVFTDPTTNKPVVDAITNYGVREIHYHKEIDFDFFFQATFEQ